MEFNSGVDFFKTKPPSLEDAGLEDPALLPDVIQEAFFLAAEKVKTAAAGILDKIDTSKTYGGCVEEGGFPEGLLDDALVDPIEENQPGRCTETHAGGVEDGHDAVIDYKGHIGDKLVEAKESKQDDGGPCISDGSILDVAGNGSDKNDGGSDEEAPGFTGV